MRTGQTTRSIVVLLQLSAAAVGCAGPQAPPPVTPGAPGGPAKQPTAADLAPIVVPSAVTPSSDFALRLGDACDALVGQSTYAAKKGTFELKALGPMRAAVLPESAGPSLRALRFTCEAIRDGNPLTDGDLKNLREFRTNPAVADQRISQILSPAKALPQSTVGAALASSGSLEANIIAGLTQFIYDRAKQQATLYLSKELAAKLCVPPHDLFFSNVCATLKKTEPQVSLAAMGTFLATAARRDVQGLPDKALAYEQFRVKDGAAAHTDTAGDVLAGGRFALAYYRAVGSGRTAMDVARSLHQIPTTVPGGDTKTFVVIAQASRLLDAVQAQTGWTNVPSAGDISARRYALGTLLTLEELYKTDAAAPTLAPDTAAKLVPVVSRFLVDMKAITERLQTAVADLAAAPGPPAGGDFHLSEGRGTASGGGSGGRLTIRDYMIGATQTLSRTLADGVVVADVMGALPAGLNEVGARKKLVFVAQVFEVGEQIVGGKSPSDLAILALDLFDRIGAQIEAAGSMQGVKVMGDVRPIVALITQIAQATSADEVAKILEAAAVPVSAYETKYRNPTVALAAMVGASGGVETLRTDGASWSTEAVVGGFAPVGFTVSTPLSDKWHVGGMLSVINVGSLVTARFKDDIQGGGTATSSTTVENEPSVKLANVLTPGFFLTLGVFGSPFMLAVGGQVVPEARQVVTTSASGSTSTSTVPAVQVIGALSIDVPILLF